MLNVKKLLSGILMILLIATIFIGCGVSNKETSQAKDSAKDVQNEKKEIKSSKKEEAKETDFPKKSLQIIVPYSAGGGTDTVTRALADSAKKVFNQSVVVVNKTGGAGVVGMSAVMTSKPDGYTCGTITGEIISQPQLGLAPDTFSYKNCRPIMMINAEPSAITVKSDSQWNTLEEFLQYAKENPGKVKVGTSGSGTIWHLAAINIESETGIKFVKVPFQGGANEASVALLGGHLDAITVSPAEVASHVNSGQLKILAATSEERSKFFPEVKTFKECGLNLVTGTWRGIAVPKDVPDDIAKILEDGFTKAVNDDAFVKFMENSGMTIQVLNSNELQTKLDNDNNSFKKIAELYNKENKQ